MDANVHAAGNQSNFLQMNFRTLVVIGLIVMGIHPTSVLGGGTIPMNRTIEKDVVALHDLGYLDELFIGFRPYSRMEISRKLVNLRHEIGQSQYRGNFHPASFLILDRLEQELQEELRSIRESTGVESGIKDVLFQALFLDGAFSSGGLDRGQSIKNFEGRPYEKGANFYTGISVALPLGGKLLLFLGPEFQYVEGDVPDTKEIKRVRLQEGYLKYHTSFAEFQAGKVPLWWGQGIGGSLILSNNMEPPTMIRLYKESPFIIPLPFQKKGLMTYDFFVSRLEKERELPEPIFWGLRIGFKPHPLLEIGLARTAMMGGGDRPVTLETVYRSFLGIGENTSSEAGNQIGGIDMRFRGRLWDRPLTIYGELYGEDEAGGLPSSYAYLAGVHLLEIPFFQGNSLWLEYANNTGLFEKSPGIWYRHHLYTDGYTYKGRIMGHGMGSDADDLILRWEIYLLRKGKVFLGFERNRFNLFDPEEGEIIDYFTGMDYPLKGKIRLALGYILQRAVHIDNIDHQDTMNHEIWFSMQFHPAGF